MSSVPAGESERRDPANAYLHRMNVRRLEAEAIRDSLLAVSGRFNSTLYGPSVPVHLTNFMEGRGRPAHSGPLDGDGRRSVYQGLRRNFLNPMLLAFDAPVPFSTMGRRNVSNVPAQALTLLNDPFVAECARAWAARTVAGPEQSNRSRLEALYQTAFGRPPTEAEARASLAFLSAANAGDNPGGRASERAEGTIGGAANGPLTRDLSLGERMAEGQVRVNPATLSPAERGSEAALRAWADLCHVLINMKEFVFVN